MQRIGKKLRLPRRIITEQGGLPFDAVAANLAQAVPTGGPDNGTLGRRFSYHFATQGNDGISQGLRCATRMDQGGQGIMDNQPCG